MDHINTTDRSPVIANNKYGVSLEGVVQEG